jgi:Fur family zinc uptake transcriptional regulator
VCVESRCLLHYNMSVTENRFAPSTEDMLQAAERFCERRQVRLTDQRRQVLGLILDGAKPLGAYELLDRMRATGTPSAAPPTVYRALDFLLAQGLIHKVERLSAFVACTHALHPHEHGDHPLHAVQFLICTRCGRTTEISDPAIGKALAAAAESAGFTLTGVTVEAEGLCRACTAMA